MVTIIIHIAVILFIAIATLYVMSALYLTIALEDIPLILKIIGVPLCAIGVVALIVCDIEVVRLLF